MKVFSVICVGCLGITTSLFGALDARESYEPIVASKMFGDIAAKETSNLSADQQKQKEEIAQKFRMCGITDMPDGSRAIAFIDETSGTMASYVLSVGESQNGFKLLSADYEHETATLSKDALTFTLGLGRGMLDEKELAEVKSQIAAEEEPEAEEEAPRSRRRGGALPGAKEGGRRSGSFRDRLLKRQAARAEAEKSEQTSAEAALKEKQVAAARRIQIDRIKQGLAPTEPITLTAEEDAELEAAGAYREQAAQPAQPANPPEEP